MIFQKSMNKAIISAALFVLAFWLITGVVAVRRAKRGSNDFDTFYLAGQKVLRGEGVYYTGEYYENREGRGPFLYSPAAACLFWLRAAPRQRAALRLRRERGVCSPFGQSIVVWACHR